MAKLGTAVLSIGLKSVRRISCGESRRAANATCPSAFLQVQSRGSSRRDEVLLVFGQL